MRRRVFTLPWFSRKVSRLSLETGQQWTSPKVSEFTGSVLQGRQLPLVWTRKVRSNLTSFESGALLEPLKFKWRLVRHISKFQLLRINCL